MRAVHLRVFCLCLFAASTPGSAALAGTVSVDATIKMIRTGWNRDAFAIVTNEPIKNPAGCAVADGYETDVSQPGYNTYYVAAMAAFIEHARVVITVWYREDPNHLLRGPLSEDCSITGRPKLIGINVIR